MKVISSSDVLWLVCKSIKDIAWIDRLVERWNMEIDQIIEYTHHDSNCTYFSSQENPEEWKLEFLIMTSNNATLESTHEFLRLAATECKIGCRDYRETEEVYYIFDLESHHPPIPYKDPKQLKEHMPYLYEKWQKNK